MKAMKLTGIRRMEMMDVPDVQIKNAGDVLVKLKAVGICGSDVIITTPDGCVQNIRRQVGCVQDALDMIDNNLFDVDFMATHHFTFEQTKQAFDLVAAYDDGVVKAMIEF